MISPIQLVGLSFLCLKCRAIVRCSPSEYLEKENDRFKQAMKTEEFFALPPASRIEISGPDLFRSRTEAVSDKNVLITCDRGIIVYEGKTI